MFCRQRQDPSLRRGGEQVSVVVLAEHPLSAALVPLSAVAGHAYFGAPGSAAPLQQVGWGGCRVGRVPGGAGAGWGGAARQGSGRVGWGGASGEGAGAVAPVLPRWRGCPELPQPPHETLFVAARMTVVSV